MQVLVTGPQLRFLLSIPELTQPLERGEGPEPVGVFMKMDRLGLLFSQREGDRFPRRGEPCQVHPRGPQIRAADYPATLLETAPALFCVARLYHRIKSHPGKGNEKIRQKPLGVLPPEKFRLATGANRDLDPHVFQALRIAITARDITVDLKRMHFSA